METKLKQRLIGAGVIIALAVIFIPILFQHANNTNQRVELTATLPSQPQSPLQSIDKGQANNTASAQTAELSLNQMATPSLTPQTQNTTPQAVKAIQIEKSTNAKITANHIAIAPTATKNTAKNNHPSVNTNKANSIDALIAAQSSTKKIPATKTQASLTQHPTKHQATAKKLAQKVSRHVTHGGHSAWVVQLASFSVANNAKALVTRLRAKGYPAYAYTTHEHGKEYLRVFVGPKFKHQKAQNLLAQLQKDFNLRGVVVNYQP